MNGMSYHSVDMVRWVSYRLVLSGEIAKVVRIFDVRLTSPGTGRTSPPMVHSPLAPGRPLTAGRPPTSTTWKTSTSS